VCDNSVTISTLQDCNITKRKSLGEFSDTVSPFCIFDTNITHKAHQVLGQNKRLVLRIDTNIVMK